MPIVETVSGVIQSSLALIGRDAFLTGWFDGCKKRIVEERKLPGNHDIVKGIRTAHLCALRQVVSVHKDAIAGLPPHEVEADEEPFSQSMGAFIDQRLRRFREHDLDTDVLTLDDLNHVLDDILRPAVQEGFETSPANARERAIARALAEIETDAGLAPPPLFQRAFRGTFGKAGWYEAFSLYVAEELKTNERFRSIFQARQLVDLRGSIDTIIGQIHAANTDLGTYMDEVRGQLGCIETEVKAVHLSVNEIKQTYIRDIKRAREAHHASESDLVSLLAYILEQRISPESIASALDQAWERLSELRRGVGSLKGLANEAPEIAPLVEEADEALAAGDGFSLNRAALSLAKARERYLGIIAERDAQLKRDKTNIAELLGKEAEIATLRFDYGAAVDFYWRQLDCLIDAYGEEHPSTAMSYINIAHNLDDQGKLIEAEPLHQKSVEIFERVFGTDHPDTATSHGNLAENLRKQGKYKAATPLHQRSLEIFEHMFGTDHPDTATSYNNLALNLKSQGKYEAAEPLHQKSLEIYESVLGPDHPYTATSYNNLAENFRAQGKYGEAAPHYQKCLNIRERVFGIDHPETAAAYNTLALNLHAQGKYEAAAPLYQKSLEIREHRIGTNHPYTAAIYNNLADNLRAQGRYRTAAPLYQKSLEISERVLGTDHPDTAQTYGNLAANLNGQKKYNEALVYAKLAISILEKSPGKHHGIYGFSLHCRSEAEWGLGLQQQAEATMAEALDCLRIAVSENHIWLGEALACESRIFGKPERR